MDSRRKKLKQDLELRENQASTSNETDQDVKLRNDIERLRKEGEKLLREEINKLQEDLLREIKAEGTDQDVNKRLIKARWSKVPHDQIQYTEGMLRRIFSKYGDLIEIGLLKNKAIIEFADSRAAVIL